MTTPDDFHAERIAEIVGSRLATLRDIEARISAAAPTLPVGISPVQWLLTLRRLTQSQRELRARYMVAKGNADIDMNSRHERAHSDAIYARLYGDAASA